MWSWPREQYRQDAAPDCRFSLPTPTVARASRMNAPVELIRWLDSASINGGLWVDPDLIDNSCMNENGLTQVTVGFVQGESPDVLLLVQSIGPDRVGAALAIPKKAIVERKKIAEVGA